MRARCLNLKPDAQNLGECCANPVRRIRLKEIPLNDHSPRLRRSTRVSPRSRYTWPNCYEPEKPSRGSRWRKPRLVQAPKSKEAFQVSGILARLRKGGPLDWPTKSPSNLVQILAQRPRFPLRNLENVLHNPTDKDSGYTLNTTRANSLLFGQNVKRQQDRCRASLVKTHLIFELLTFL